MSIDVERHHDHGITYKGKHLVGVVQLQFRGSVHYHHDEKQGSMKDRCGAGEGAENFYILTHRHQEVVQDTGHI